MKTAATRELARRELLVRACRDHPAHWLDHVTVMDERAAEPFSFHLNDPGHPWYWQRQVLDELLNNRRVIILKARQLGITWLTAGKSLWKTIWRPGSTALVYRQKEADAVDVVCRMYDMFISTPEWLRNGAVLTRPLRARPSTSGMEFTFPDGKTSRILPMTSAVSAGHGYTASEVLLDEFAYMDNAESTIKAVSSSIGQVGSLAIVSTANGTSDADGNGNGFAYQWNVAEENGMTKIFLGWQKHPDRDQHWYDTSPEVRDLRPHQRAEQYPSNEHEAFLMTGKPHFDIEALAEYAKNPSKALYRADFKPKNQNLRVAALQKSPTGRLTVYHEPKKDVKYAVGADIATGRGKDYSCAYVVNLSEMRFEAEYHGKVDADLFASQLHYLGKWYNDAWMAPETAGGYGEAVIIALRDGKQGRPPYPNLYRHVMSARPDQPIMKNYGFPTNSRTRPLIINNFERAVRERTIPDLPAGLLQELRSFVDSDKLPSPSAAKGMNDDRVMTACITLELYRQKGSHPKRAQRTSGRKAYTPAYPWQNKERVA